MSATRLKNTTMNEPITETITEKAGPNLDAREAKKLAQRIADHFEGSARKAKEGRFIEGQARKVIAEIYALSNTDQLPSSSLEDFLNSWLKRKEIEAGEKTFLRYGVVVEQFLKRLGTKSGLDLSHITSKEVTDFRDSLAGRLSANTVNFSIKVLRAVVAEFPGVRLWDPIDEFCDAESCYAMRNGIAQYSDDNHISGKMSAAKSG